MELTELLRSVEAPAELIQWVEPIDDFELVWSRCVRGDHRIWIAAASGMPIELVVEAAAAAVLTTVDTFGDVHALVPEAIDLAVSGASVEALREIAEACEHLAEGGLGDYRRAFPPGHRAAAAAAALVARAAEGLAVGEAIREAARLERARSVAAIVGIATSAALSQGDVARLSVSEAAADPAQGSFLFAIAAAAEAIAESVLAVALGTPDPEQTRGTAERQLDAVVREAIEAALNDDAA